MRAIDISTTFRRASGIMVLLAVLGCGSTTQMLAAEGDFTRGNQLYASGKFTEAAAAYETQVQHGQYTANLFYNLGDAYYRLGNRGRAILNYRRALLLEPSHAEAAANLAFVGGGPIPATTNGVGLSVDALCWLTASTFWITVAGLVTYWLSPFRRGPGTVLMAVGLSGFVAGACLLWQGGVFTRHGARALIIAADAPAHYSPADNSKVVTTLAAGAEVQVLSAQGAWIYALLEDRTRAWVASDKVEWLVPSHER